MSILTKRPTTNSGSRTAASIDCHTAPLRDAKEKYLGRIWYYRDITERKLAV